ncbi:MAG: DUF3267 domain-containing protein [Paludibacter sp.]|nr:DUF3267 domain-containing protein [Paludibacter sp.]
MTYEDIVNGKDFELEAEVSHSGIKNFLIPEIEKQPVYARIANMYQITGMLAFVLGGFKAFMPFFTQRNSVYLWEMFFGLIFSFTILIFIHEGIHAIAYKCVGVKHLSFGMQLKKFLFYVQANKQVIDSKQFTIVALAPAVTVATLSLLGMIFFYDKPLFYFFIPIFAFHSLFCGGDFGLLSFFQNRSDKEIVTFDLKKEGKTYFYSRKKQTT